MNANDSSGRRKSSESRRGPDPTASTSQALVLGAGCVSGIAWITGLLTGLADAGKDVTDVELIVGTSAGATVAAQLGSGLSLQELYARQVQPELQSAEIAQTIPESERRAVIESRLPSQDWPVRALKLFAVDAESGEPRIFDSASGVGILDAVTASCAVPGVWPPTTIDGRRYIDGGVRSGTNAEA